MKKFTAMWLQSARIDMERKPKPFPGKFPTKIAVRWRREGGKAVKEYIGVPNARVCKMLAGMVNNPNKLKKIWLVAVEFDAGGVVSRSSMGEPHRVIYSPVHYRKVGHLHATEFSNILRQYYHPDEAIDTHISTMSACGAAGTKTLVRKIKGKEKVHRVYFLTPTLSRIKNIDPFKAWLHMRGID